MGVTARLTHKDIGDLAASIRFHIHFHVGNFARVAVALFSITKPEPTHHRSPVTEDAPARVATLVESVAFENSQIVALNMSTLSLVPKLSAL